MIKLRAFYDDNREIEELIRLLSPRINYCKTHPDEIPKRANFGIVTDDLLVDLANENADEASETEEIVDDTPYTEGGMNDEG